MLPWIIQISVISLILIALVHYLFTFFKTALTVPKVKDLVDKPKHQYEVLFNTVHVDNNANKKNDNISHNNNDNNNNDNIIPNTKTTQEERSIMKSELKNYLKELNNPSSSAFPSSLKKSTLENAPPSSYNMDAIPQRQNTSNPFQSQIQDDSQKQEQNNNLNNLETHSFGNSMYSSY